MLPLHLYPRILHLSLFTIAASPPIDLRKSVATCARYTFSIAISDIIVVSPPASPVRALAFDAYPFLKKGWGYHIKIIIG